MYTHRGKSTWGHLEWPSASQGQRSFEETTLLTVILNSRTVKINFMVQVTFSGAVQGSWQTNTNVILQMTTFATHPVRPEKTEAAGSQRFWEALGSSHPLPPAAQSNFRLKPSQPVEAGVGLGRSLL